MSASRRSSSSAVPKCMKRPPDQVPSAVYVGSRAIAQKGTRRAARPAAPCGARRRRTESGRIAGMRSPLLVLLMLVALVGAGCGGDDGGGAGKTTSNEDYGKQLAQAGQTLQKTFSDIGDESGSS